MASVGEPTIAIIDTAAMKNPTNENFIPDYKLVMIQLIKWNGIGSEILHGWLIKGVASEINVNVSWDCCFLPIDDEMILQCSTWLFGGLPCNCQH